MKVYFNRIAAGGAISFPDEIAGRGVEKPFVMAFGV